MIAASVGGMLTMGLMMMALMGGMMAGITGFVNQAGGSVHNASSMGDRCDDTSDSVSAVGGGAAGLPDVVGMWEAQAQAWFDGQQGPNNVCAPYAWGQCTWWSCMREHKMGNTTGSYWGNGQDWVSSAAGNGWQVGKVAVGSVVSFAAGTTAPTVGGGSVTVDPSYGHVAVIESVDENAKTFTTSEKGGGYPVYSYTYSYDPLPAGVSVAAPPEGGGDTAVEGSGDGGSDGVLDMCEPGEGGEASSDEDGYHASVETAKKIARDLIKSGYPDWDNDEDWEALVWIYDHESGWRWDAENPSSGAYGIPQSLPGNKMADFGSDWKDNATTQLKWGLNYIKNRYGSPTGAKSFWESHNWY